MKKLVLTLAAGALLLGANAQCYKYVVLEHFTQASCGPCAAQNPGFETNILNPNTSKVRHIAYHTSWPGVDHMYNNNTTDNGARPTYYSITGVPSVKMNGNVKTGGPSAFTQSDIDNEAATGSPLQITVTVVPSGNTRNVTVVVKSVGVPPSGSFNLVAGIVERVRNYNTAPGSNGETHFPNVFLDMLTTGTNGQAITLAPQGQSVTVNFSFTTTQSTLTFLTNPSVNTNNLGVFAFIQNNTTKNIVQCGADYDTPVNAVMFQPSVLVKEGINNQTSSFPFQVGNGGGSSEQFTYTLTSSGAPTGWTSSFTVNSNQYTTTGTLSVPANTNYNATIDVVPNNLPGVGKYTLTITSVTNPNAPAMSMSVWVISGVTDLIVNNTGGLGTGSGNPSQFQSQFVAGLQFAGNTTYAVTDAFVLERGIADGAMNGVKNIYFNMAWSFPTFTDGLVAQLTTFLNGNAKRMFICGQDLGWETWDAQSTYWTANTRTFFTNFLCASYVSDGNTTAQPITANVSDPIFGTTGSNATTTATYGANNYFPDIINAATNGTVIYYYNGNQNQRAGVRATNNNFKTVYLAVGIEQLTNTSSKNTILKISHDWFYGLTSDEEFDAQMAGLTLGQNYPNPSNTVTNIPMSNVHKDLMFQVIDVNGKVVFEQMVQQGTELVTVNTENLGTGVYLYRLMDGNVMLSSKAMQVIR